MKTQQKNLRRILFLSLLASSLMACEGIPDKTDDDVTDYDGPPKQIITVQQAKTMYDSYTKRRVSIIKDFEEAEDSTQEFHPTRYGQYTYETMKHYMDFIEDEAKLAKVEIKGLRFYFSNYPADGSVGSAKYARHNSFFLLPTTDFNGKELGFFIRVDDNGDRTAVPVQDVVKRSNSKLRKKGNGTEQQGNPGFGSKMLLLNPVFQGGGVEDISLVLNDASLIPPPSTGKDDFGNN
ncbi:hypothetical protein [Marixanthomonas ophiurae]|uniref:Lipoprotein n=1 Tax=Marixanthomonas ophiurae TaxID=387659 RepID=A0A3E1QDH9_9FLAO|nr:hypothetical protein [Marixanthomonas ophiurae]RFN60167.1 hypothetical protein DZ858_09030 [Marixanthomonas ophiurae]